MNKLEAAVNCLIKAASKVHPLIHALKATQPKPARKPRTRRPKMYDGAAEAEAAAPTDSKPVRKHRTRRFKLPAEEEPVVAAAAEAPAAGTKGSTRAICAIRVLRKCIYFYGMFYTFGDLKCRICQQKNNQRFGFEASKNNLYTTF